MYESGRAVTADLAAVRVLLERAGLPTSDLATAKAQFIVIREGERVIATGALQPFGSAALLRSVVVAPDRRGIALGRRIVQELEGAALAAQMRQLVLLTQTAKEFFAHLGYRVIERDDVPLKIQASEEFRSLCPSSATCMVKELAESH